MNAMREQPRWSTVLRALREARGVTQEGWAARLSVSRATVQRWESGERAPDPGAEMAILDYCKEAGLLRSFSRGPLSGLVLSEAGLRDILGEARWRGDGHATRLSPALRLEAATDSQPGNLPAQLTSFVGREREVATLRRVQAGTRLLTLTGAGGCGKTRLALALAAELLWAYPHGIWFVNLAPLADPALAPQEIAASLAIRTSGQQPLVEALADILRERHLLLLLDNCEHLLPACAALVESLLRACPHLEILATSRESLGVSGETVWRVPPLSLPAIGIKGQGAGDRTESGSALGSQSSDAVRLFIERARLQRTEFAFAPSDEAAVAEICLRLDGLPLAIELAAARVRMLSVAQIAARLNGRFQFLTDGGRLALPRQQTLRGTMDWSYDLLSAAEQALLRRLSVFASGFSLEAAEVVMEDEDLLDLLTHLVDKSLVVAEEQGGASRYRMLETVRQYGEEKLAEAGEAPAKHERHAQWCLALAEAARQHNSGPEQSGWLERLTVEYGNIRAALGWCLANEQEATLGLRLAGAMPWYWELRGDLGEGRRWLEALLALSDAAPTDVRCIALDGAGILARNQGDVPAAVGQHEQSLALARELGDEALIARSLNGLAIAVAWAGEPAHARVLFEESLALQQKLGNRLAIAISLMDLGNVATDLDEPDRAVALYEEGLVLARELGDRRHVATLLQNLGNRYRGRGAWDLAAARYHEALSAYRELQDRIGIIRCLRVIAHLTLDRGDPARVARLCGAADALREAHGIAFEARGDAAFERTRAAAQTALGDAAFAAAWAAGQAMTQEQAITEALAATAENQPQTAPT